MSCVCVLYVEEVEVFVSEEVRVLGERAKRRKGLRGFLCT